MSASCGASRVKVLASLISVAIVSGCASVDFDRQIAKSNQDAAAFTNGQLSLAQTDEQRAAFQRTTSQLLEKPLGQADAVQLALVNSPALQAMLAENWATAARAAQAGRIANPLFLLSRVRVGAELEIERTLTFGLLDLLLLPQRYGIAQRNIELAQLRLTNDVVDQITQVRQAWVRAVSAQQSVVYAKQVLISAEASAELARRMQAVGNFSKLMRARQQAFYADAATQYASAQNSAATAREELVRVLGLTDAQSEQLKPPDRLPDLPSLPRDPTSVSTVANAGRIDVRIARATFESAAQLQGLTLLSTYATAIRRITR